MSMLVLALDTSTPYGSVGWIRAEPTLVRQDPEGWAEACGPALPGHAETLVGRCEEVLLWGGYDLGQVELMVCGLGPGSFTGLRIGLSTAKGMALAGDIPLVGLSSLEMLAVSSGVQGLVAPLTDARRGELFAGLYDVHKEQGWPRVEVVWPAQVGRVAEIAGELSRQIGKQTAALLGTGLALYRDELTADLGGRVEQLPASFSVPRAFWLARCGLDKLGTSGADDLDTLVPNYLRQPDATLPQLGRRIFEPR